MDQKEYASYQQRKPDIHQGFAGARAICSPVDWICLKVSSWTKTGAPYFPSAVTALMHRRKRVRLSPRHLVINRHHFPLTVPHKYRPAVSIMKRIQRVETYIQPAAAHIAQHRGGITVNAGTGGNYQEGQDKQKPRRAVNIVSPSVSNTSNQNGPNLTM